MGGATGSADGRRRWTAGRGVLAVSAIIGVVLVGVRRVDALDVVALGGGAAQNQLYTFDAVAPGTIAGPVPIGGLTAGDVVVGIDFRPSTHELIGLAVNGNTTRLYRVAPRTGAATPIGAATVMSILGATAWDVDVNPASDRLRVVNNLATDGNGGNVNNFRMNLDNGALSGSDPDLDFTAVVDAAPEVGVAYINNVATTGGVTAIFGITAGEVSDRLVQNGGSGPGFSLLQDVGALGVNTSTNGGLDIVEPDNQAFALLEVAGVSGLYAVNLTTGAATLIGTIGTGNIDFAGMAISLLEPRVQLGAASVSVSEAAGVVAITVGCTECDLHAAEVDLVTGNGTARAGIDYFPLAQTLELEPSESTATVQVFLVDDFEARGDRTFTVTLSNPSTGAVLGDPAVATVTIVDDDVPPTSTTLPATGTPVPLRLLLVKPGKLGKVVVAGPTTLPAPGGGDPTARGGALTLAGATGSVTYDLPAPGWKALGRNGTKGFRHRGPACKVIAKPQTITAVCKGGAGTLAVPDAGPVNAVLVLGDARYCAQCGGTEKGNAAKVVKRVRCAAPTVCP